MTLLVHDKVASPEETYVEDDQYRIQYTVTSSAFRRLYVSGLTFTGETCNASEICEPHPFLRPGQVLDKEIKSELEDQKPGQFATEVLSSGYKNFQLFTWP